MTLRSLAVSLLLALVAAPAHAALLDFTIEWRSEGLQPPDEEMKLLSSGIGPIEPLQAIGFITLDTDVLQNPGFNGSPTSIVGITAFEVTVEGVTFGLSDFAGIIFATNTELDLTTELVGQPVSGGGWGIVGSKGSDFNIFGKFTTSLLPQNSPPRGIGPNVFRSGSGNNYALTSFRPTGGGGPTNPIPEPSAALLFVGGALLTLRRVRR